MVTTERECDQLLVDRARDGDRAAFDMLVVKYQRRLLRLLKRVVRDPVEAEDVVQETFIRAYRALHHFRGDAAFYTWLYRIGINTARNYLASQNRRMQASSMDPTRDESLAREEQLRDNNTPESVLASKQVALTVNSAVEELPADLRTVIVLRELEGLSYEQIAAIMDCPIGTVRSRIYRAREAIAERVGPLLDKATEGRW